MKQKHKVLGLLMTSLLVLSACGREAITSESSGLWSQFVYFFATMIKALSPNGMIGVGIILFTLLVRVLMIPIYNLQMTSSRKMQELQPKIKAIQAKYPEKDMDSRIAMNEEVQVLYKTHEVNPFSSMLPLLVQMPVLFGLFQALTRVDFLKQGHFLWFDIAKTDSYLILPVLAALFTFLSMWLSNKALKEKNTMMTIMMMVTPAMILGFGLIMASGVALYWAVSNAFQVGQTLVFNNPYKIIAERERLAAEEKERASKIRRAMKKAQKRK